MYTKALQTQLRTRSDDRASLGLKRTTTPCGKQIFTLSAALNQAFKAACISVLAVEPTFLP
jgi:hypothetical protein